ncbi:S1 RNA-binding domain-containing protein [Streptomyces sp. NPDC059538]|uniref:S1 RNA-binding domain-containing protein n=1 Tax=Streptomyces sp. NPDC059538 TaxID=3346860 RepID=UPI0036A5CD36
MPPFTYRLSPAAAVPYARREQVAEAAVAAAGRFARDAGVERLTIDNPMARGFFSFADAPAPRAPELTGLFPADPPGAPDASGPAGPSGYHDGARVPLATGRAEILDVDLGRERVSLSVKALHPDPWRAFADTHPIGATLPATVTRSVPFGVVVQLAPGVEGLVHRSALREGTFESGDEVRATLLGMDLRRRRISLGLDG